MKGFKKLALASAIAALPVAGFSMEALEDESLSQVTGQDGIDISLSLSVTGADVMIEDDDGVGDWDTFNTAGVTTSVVSNFVSAGAILVNNLDINGDIDISIDTGSDASDNAMLFVGIDVSNLSVGLDSVAVQATDGNFGLEGSAVTILSSPLNLSLGTVTLDVQLGSEQTDFVTINGNIGSLTLTGVSVDDADSGGTISVGSLSLTGLTLYNTTANVNAGGLVVDTGRGLTNVGVTLENVQLGDATGSIGDIQITGLSMQHNTITISDH